MNRRVLAMVLAGGSGSRLYPLTKNRAKPSVPFGGKYRIIDFVLSNLLNSGIHSVYVLTQFKSQSLLQHLRNGWQFSGLLPHQFITPVPAQMLSPDTTWYQGTADAIFQNLDLITRAEADLVLVFSADHVYRMDLRPMIECHIEKGAAATVAAIPMDRKLSAEFGVIESAGDGSICGFYEKDADAPTIPGHPDTVDASMGNYVFNAEVLKQALQADAGNENSSHDFGKDVLPDLLRWARVFCYDFNSNKIPGELPDQPPYWRDVGTIDAYYQANMDLRAVTPSLNLYNREWPLRSSSHPDPPAKFVFDDEGRRGHAVDSVVSSGCILSGGLVRNSVLGRRVRIHSGAVVTDSVILDNCDIGRRARVNRAILDKNVRVFEDENVGYGLAESPHQFVTESGIVIVSGERSPVEIQTLDL